MAISLASLRHNNVPKPPRLLVYGVAGVGKTSLAASAPAPVFIQTEDGLGGIDAPSFGILKTYGEVMEALGSLYTEDHEFKTIIVDSVDWLEPLVWGETCRQNDWKDIEQPGYGRGYVAAVDVWRSLLEGLTALRDDKGMAVILIAHSDIRKFSAPDTEPYDRYVIKLQTRASAILQEHVDMVLFCNYRVSIVKDKVAGSKEGRARAVGGGNRIVYTEERPSFLAKNRANMPDSISLPDDPTKGWDALSQHIPYYATQQKEAA